MRFSQYEALRPLGVEFPNVEANLNLPVSKLGLFREMIRRIESLPGFKGAAYELKNQPWFPRVEDSLYLDENVREKMESSVERLKTIDRVIGELLKANGDGFGENTVAVLYPKPHSLSDLVGEQSKLCKALEQVLYSEHVPGAKVEPAGWENGSFWMHIYLGTPLAVALIGALTWAAAVVRKKRIEGDILCEKLRQMEISTELLKEVSDKASSALNECVDIETMAVYEKHLSGGKKHDPEYLERMKGTVRMLSEFVTKGGEVHPSLMAPEKAKNVFPDFKALETIFSTIPLLKEKGEGQEEK